MISLIFETRQFRVQIRDHMAFVESREGKGWSFRNQYNLPIPADSLHGRGEIAVLAAAVRNYERKRGGDPSLREALANGGETNQASASAGALPSRI